MITAIKDIIRSSPSKNFAFKVSVVQDEADKDTFETPVKKANKRTAYRIC
jgi:hypothetical protein